MTTGLAKGNQYETLFEERNATWHRGLMFSTADAQQIYKWVDQQGVTHYSEQAPAGNHAKTIYIHSHRAETHPSQPPALETANDTKEQLSAEQHLASQAQLPTPEQNRVQQQNCATARQKLRALENAGRVRQLNPNTGNTSTSQMK